MSADIELWPLEGTEIDIGSLSVEKAQRFAELLRTCGEQVYAKLQEVRRRGDGTEFIIFTVDVERPQKLAHDIKRVEWLQAAFEQDQSKPPVVSLLRKNFPLVPHTNLTPKEIPRQACLYEQGWDEVRLNWNAAQFLMRIRFWLSKTATGTLHAEDQPLEPLIMASSSRLILPADFSLTGAIDSNGLLGVGRIPTSGPHIVLTARWKGQERQAMTHAAAAIFECRTQTHGVIRHQPANLFELNELCIEAGLDLIKQLTDKVREWHREKPDPKILQAQLIIILLLPKSRMGTVIEAVDVFAFLTGKTVEQIGQALGAIGKKDSLTGYIIGEIKTEDEEIKKVPVALIQVHHSLDSTAAAKLNGTESQARKIVAVGMGALGSQIFNIMVRAGFGSWTLVDDDLLLPHNCARHFLGNWAVGHNKAEAMAMIANEIFDGPDVAKSIEANLLRPGDKKPAIEEAIRAADTLLDFSASVAVSRELGSAGFKARVLSSFLTPGGNSLIVAIEDLNRAIRIDWLEMLHYRSTLNNPRLNGMLLGQENPNVRYGNACRDLSSRISEDDVALWAAMSSKEIKELVAQKDAALKVFVKGKDGGVEVIREEVTEVISVVVGKWTIRFDRALLRKLGEFRSCKLPNETGGVLVGHFDTHHHMCSVVDMIPSPPDSVEWPVSYIRGCDGLREKIEEIGRATLGQLQYVGEWHSHPDGCSTSPSNDDLEAYSWLVGHMNKEDLPAIMMIVGEEDDFHFIAVGK